MEMAWACAIEHLHPQAQIGQFQGQQPTGQAAAYHNHIWRVFGGHDQRVSSWERAQLKPGD
jgi:hypothetical protein